MIKDKRRKIRIVGIGTSAGGLDALGQFFSNVSETCGMAFVIIQHLDPTHTGILPELLQRSTLMKVVEVKENMSIEINCVYVIPSNTSMSIKEEVLHLSRPIESRGLRLPIDFFFRSLASSKKSLSVGIILSGLGSDGSDGVREIKEQHGIVMVQDPATAAFNSMPLMAIDSVVVDVIAPANELFTKLLKLLRTPPSLRTHFSIDESGSVALQKIIILLRKRTGNDFSLYKKNTILRRVERRMGIHKIEEISVYARYMQNNPNEIDIFFKELVIGVTSFFRDQMVWDKLRDEVIPDMLLNIQPGTLIRAWVAGCSTGEEAYSLAIIFKEVFEKYSTERKYNLQIFATDIDNEAIQIARNGVFSTNIAENVSPHRLKKYFTKTKNEYKINTEIRDMIVFAQHNLIMQPPFTNIDLISCRNLLIYIDAELQKKIMRLFNYSIKPEGVLILGSAETNGQDNNNFYAIDSKLKLFRRSETSLMPDLQNFPSTIVLNKQNNIKREINVDSDFNVESLADKHILKNYSPVAIMVNENGDIVYINGAIGKFLDYAVGKASMNIFPMLKDGLCEPFSEAFKTAKNKKTKIVLKNILIGDKRLQINIEWVDKSLIISGVVMITFIEPTEICYTRLLTPKNTTPKNPCQLKLGKSLIDNDNNGTTIKNVLNRNKMSENEELQALNKVLQATNEELTASREEMQSLNEELQIVNSELVIKAEDYFRLTNDMKNLLNSTDIKILILDNKMNIRRYTTQATNIFKLIKTDIGRPLTDLVSVLIYPDFIEDAQRVLDTLLFSEKQIHSKDGKWYIVRIMPYLTLDDKIDGLVMTFIDISDLKMSELKMSEIESELDFVNKFCGNPIIKLSVDNSIISFNPKAELYFERLSKDIVNKSFIKLFIPESDHQTAENKLKQIKINENTKPISFKIIKDGDKTKEINTFVDKLSSGKKEITRIIIIN